MGASLLPFVVPLIVTTRLSSTSNAYFYTTWMMAGIFLIISPSVSQSLFAEGVHSPHELLNKARKALGVIAAILLPCIIGIFALGGLLLSAFGASYESHATELLKLVLIASIPDAVTNVYVAVMRVQGRLATAASVNMGMGIGIIVFSWMFLPTLGISRGWVGISPHATMRLCFRGGRPSPFASDASWRQGCGAIGGGLMRELHGRCIPDGREEMPLRQRIRASSADETATCELREPKEQAGPMATVRRVTPRQGKELVQSPNRTFSIQGRTPEEANRVQTH